jgi:hypothetical protein
MITYMFRATILSSLLLCGALIAQSAAPAASQLSSSGTAVQASTPTQNSTPGQTPAKPAGATPHSRYRPDRFAGRAGTYYRLVWGVDDLEVKWTEAGEVITFRYQVLDPQKAKMLNDKRYEPALIDPRAGVKLVVPSLEKVGKLRQATTPEAGKAYWMAFSNKGRLVKRGDHVNVVIGKFHADGLVVD